MRFNISIVTKTKYKKRGIINYRISRNWNYFCKASPCEVFSARVSFNLNAINYRLRKTRIGAKKTMTRIIPRISVKRGVDAINTYKEVFGAKLLDRQQISPSMGRELGLPSEFDFTNSTMFAEVEIEGEKIQIRDDVKNRPRDQDDRIDVILDLESENQIKSIYEKARAQGFKIENELKHTFWDGYNARLVDPYGIRWELNFEKNK